MVTGHRYIPFFVFRSSHQPEFVKLAFFQIMHSRHRLVSNFIMNMVAILVAYCFFDNKPKALDGFDVENTRQLIPF